MFRISEDNEAKLNFLSTRSQVIKSIEYRLLKGVLEMSAQLGPVGVADFLMKFPVRGVVSDCQRCALAEWVRAVVEAEVHDYNAWRLASVLVDQEAIRVRLQFAQAGFIAGEPEDFEVQIPLPTDGVIQRFVKEFDDGAFPDLIA